jgi:hypothetical protein
MSEDVVETLLEECRAYRGGEPNESLRQASGAFYERSSEEYVIAPVAAALLELPPPGAAWLAIILGSVVEAGHGIEHTAPAVFSLLKSWLPDLPQVDVDDDGNETWPDPTPHQAELLELFPWICQSTVAHLGRRPADRMELAQDEALVRRLGELQGYTHGAVWVSEALAKRSGPLVVIHPPSRTGFLMHYQNVSNNFHLFSLLQTTLGTRMPGGQEPDASVAAVARGKEHADVGDSAWWHFGDPRSHEPNIVASIWGEGSPDEIPIFEGVQVILLWPPIMGSRMWDGGFLGPHLEALPSDVTIERQLSDDEVQTWLDRLQVKTSE